MASAEFSFKKYQVENGLSHNTTWCAIQDSYGFLWIGTSNGLNCYYGSGNKIYRNVLNDKYSLGNNFVGSLMEEGEDLWIGTSSVLYIYDRSDDHFLYFDKTTKYGVFISCEVKKIVKTKNGLIWIATLGQGIFIYDPVKDVLTQNSIRTFLPGIFAKVRILLSMSLLCRRDYCALMNKELFCKVIRFHSN